MLRNHGSDGAPPGTGAFAIIACPELDFRVHAPADKPCNQRELAIVACDGNLIAFGQAIRRQP